MVCILYECDVPRKEGVPNENEKVLYAAGAADPTLEAGGLL